MQGINKKNFLLDVVQIIFFVSIIFPTIKLVVKVASIRFKKII